MNTPLTMKPLSVALVAFFSIACCKEKPEPPPLVSEESAPLAPPNPGLSVAPPLVDIVPGADSAGASKQPLYSVEVEVEEAPESLPDASKVFASMKSGYRRCHSHAVKSCPTGTGSARLEVIIDTSGKPTSCKASSVDGYLCQPLLDCVCARTKSAMFPTAPIKPVTVKTLIKFSSPTAP